MSLPLIAAEWPLADKLIAFTTTRQGGVSQAPYDNFNLALHVEDNVKHVFENRQRLQKQFTESVRIKWLKQVHSSCVVDAAMIGADVVEADAAFTLDNNIACAVLTADCLPILLADKNAQCIAAVHAGWRGLLNGIIENTIEQMIQHVNVDYAWLGPAIGPQAFEVGEDVYSQYIKTNKAFSRCFIEKATHNQPPKWNLNIYQAAKLVLNAADISNVFGGEYCTYNDTDQFFSYRRQATTGRMATIIAKR